MSTIVLTTLNARYIHCAFGLRYLLANLGPLQAQAQILEFGIKQRPIDIAQEILAENPLIVGLGIYIWNVEPSLKVVQLLRLLAPQLKIVLGGPEVSYETEHQEIVQYADCVVTGEADLVFAEICQKLLANQFIEKIIPAPPPEMEQLQLPYHLYTNDDLAHRVIYVEASRGCPYTCSFCLSSLDIPVRRPNIDVFLQSMNDLLERGARHFKFVDRTFNLNIKLTRSILEFFLQRLRPGLFLHFEMVPDRLPEALREYILLFPEGALQFEIGIQTFNPEVARTISLWRDHQKTEENLKFLKGQTGVHIHADLIVGLPGETLSSFAEGFDRLFALNPHEIQVGILKRLRGTPIVQNTDAFAMHYSPFPPYEVLKTNCLTFEEGQRMRQFAHLWDRVANSGRFSASLPYLVEGESAFGQFLAFSDWCDTQFEDIHDVNLHRLGKILFTYLVSIRKFHEETIQAALRLDLKDTGHHEPTWLKPVRSRSASGSDSAPQTKRQKRHLA